MRETGFSHLHVWLGEPERGLRTFLEGAGWDRTARPAPSTCAATSRSSSSRCGCGPRSRTRERRGRGPPSPAGVRARPVVRTGLGVGVASGAYAVSFGALGVAAGPEHRADLRAVGARVHGWLAVRLRRGRRGRREPAVGCGVGDPARRAERAVRRPAGPPARRPRRPPPGRRPADDRRVDGRRAGQRGQRPARRAAGLLGHRAGDLPAVEPRHAASARSPGRRSGTRRTSVWTPPRRRPSWRCWHRGCAAAPSGRPPSSRPPWRSWPSRWCRPGCRSWSRRSCRS